MCMYTFRQINPGQSFTDTHADICFHFWCKCICQEGRFSSKCQFAFYKINHNVTQIEPNYDLTSKLIGRRATVAKHGCFLFFKS